MLAIGNEAQFFVISEMPQTLPSYIRLGKWMSKARVMIEPAQIIGEQEGGSIPFLLAAADVAPDAQFLSFDLLNVAPTPLVRHSLIRGPCYKLDHNTLLPRGMCFNLEGFA